MVVCTGAKLGPYAEHRRKRGSFEQLPLMIVDLVLKPRVACRVNTLAFKHDGSSVRHNRPGPDQKHAGLPKHDLAVVTAYQSCSLCGRGLCVCDPLGAADLP